MHARDAPFSGKRFSAEEGKEVRTVKEEDVHEIVGDHIGKYHDRHHADRGDHRHSEYHKEKKMDGAPHVHIDNREDSPAMIPGYGFGGCGDGFGGGGMLAGLLFGTLIGGRGFGGGWGGGCGDGWGGGNAASKADLAIDLRDSIVSDIQRQNIDRDVLKSEHALALQMCGVDKDVVECCCTTQKEILENRYISAMQAKCQELELFKVKCDLSGQIGALSCATRDGFKDLCHQIKDVNTNLVNSDAKQTIAGIISGLTAAPTDAQLAALTTSLQAIKTISGGCGC